MPGNSESFQKKVSVCLFMVAVMLVGTARAWSVVLSAETNTGAAQAVSPVNSTRSLFSISKVTPYKPVDNSGYVDLGGKIQPLMGQLSLFGAFHGGWIVNHHVYLGLGAYALLAPKDQLNSNQYLQFDQSAMFCGGLEGGYRFFLSEKIVLRAQLLLGLTSTDFFTQADGQKGILGDDSILIEPGIYADMKIWRNFGVSLGVHYHFTQGAEGPGGLTQSGLNQPGLELTMKWTGD
jgi:hypothetical protein